MNDKKTGEYKKIRYYLAVRKNFGLLCGVRLDFYYILVLQRLQQRQQRRGFSKMVEDFAFLQNIILKNFLFIKYMSNLFFDKDFKLILV